MCLMSRISQYDYVDENLKKLHMRFKLAQFFNSENEAKYIKILDETLAEFAARLFEWGTYTDNVSSTIHQNNLNWRGWSKCIQHFYILHVNFFSRLNTTIYIIFYSQEREREREIERKREREREQWIGINKINKGKFRISELKSTSNIKQQIKNNRADNSLRY